MISIVEVFEVKQRYKGEVFKIVADAKALLSKSPGMKSFSCGHLLTDKPKDNMFVVQATFDSSKALDAWSEGDPMKGFDKLHGDKINSRDYYLIELS